MMLRGLGGILGAVAAMAVAAVWLIVALISIALQRRARADLVRSLAARCFPPLFTALIAFPLMYAGLDNFFVCFALPLVGGVILALVIAREACIRGDRRVGTRGATDETSPRRSH